MSMYQGLDLSRFKKVSSDKKATVLRHNGGHELKVAHSGLSDEMRQRLDGLPVYLAEGTPHGKKEDEAEPEASEEESQATPAPVADQGQPTLADQAPPQPEAEPQAAPVASAPSQAAPPAPEGQAAPEPAAPVAPQAPVAPPSVSQELRQEGDAYNNDLNLGHIKPQTYQDLYAKKDTLGKIGTLFGLLVSGAGSGLTGQPNAVMEMMNKQISNDLEAQKATQSNAQNIYQLNLKHQMQQAEMKNMEINQQLAKAKNPAEIAFLTSQKKLVDVEAKTKADAASRIQSNWNALHKLTTDMKKIPQTLPDGKPNPVYQQYQSQLMVLNQGIQSENYSIADRAEAAMALSQAAFGTSPSDQTDEGDFQKNIGLLRASGNKELADDKVARHVPGIPGQASVPLTSQDRNDILSGVQFQNKMDRFIDWTKKHSGELDPKQRAEGQAMAAELQGAYRLATKGGVYKEGEQGFISNVIDSNPTKFFNSIRVLPKLQAVKRESQSQLGDLLKSKGFQGGAGGGGSKIAEEKPDHNDVLRGEDGKLYMKVPGGRIPVPDTTTFVSKIKKPVR